MSAYIFTALDLVASVFVALFAAIVLTLVVLAYYNNDLFITILIEGTDALEFLMQFIYNLITSLF